MLNSVVQPSPVLLYVQFCPVAKANYSVAVDILVQFVSIGTVLCLIFHTNFQMCWIMLFEQLHSLCISNSALLLWTSTLLLWTSWSKLYQIVLFHD